jgi:hypothetical protein
MEMSIMGREVVWESGASVPNSLCRCIGLAFLIAIPLEANESYDRTAENANAFGSDGLPPSGAWEEITLPEKLEVLEMLVAHMSGNYQKIHTWSGSYSEHSERVISARMTGGSTAVPAIESDLRAEFDCVCLFSIDLSADACLLTVKEGKESYFEAETNTPATVSLKRPLEERCVLTSEHFLKLRPAGRYRGFVALEGFDLPSKRAVFREPASNARLSLFSNFLDPRLIFCVTRNIKAWEEFENGYIPCLRGDLGDERRNLFDKKLLLSKAVQDGDVWYRATQRQPNGTPIKEQVYASHAGFNRTSLRVWKGGSISHRYTYRYQVIDGVYVPSHVDLEYDGLTNRREWKLRDCVLNKPIAPSQFTYEALGIEDGDLIMDNIEQVAYEYKSGEPEKLANYGEGPPKEPADAEQTDSPSRMIYVLLGLAVLIGVVVAFKMVSKR